MEPLLRKTVTIPNVAFFTIAEAWLLTRALPDLLPERAQRLREQNLFILVLLGLIITNYTSFVLYKVFIYNKFLSPLRTFPAPEVCIALLKWLSSLWLTIIRSLEMLTKAGSRLLCPSSPVRTF